MRKLIVTGIATCILFASATAECKGTNEVLNFFIVTDIQAPGQHFIDNIPNTPKTGFVSPKPDLVLRNIKEVQPDPGADVKGPTLSRVLTVLLNEQDVPRFTDLCTRAGARVLLINLGDETIGAPRTSNSALRVDRFTLFFPPHEYDRRLNDLKRLVR